MEEQPADRSVDRWVLGYLQKRGYANAQEALAADAAIQEPEAMAAEITADISTSLTHLVSFYDSSRGPSPRSYEEGYNGLKNYIESSLHKYRRELHRVLYPVFVYAFLEMVNKDFQDQAKAFFQRHRGGHAIRHAAELKSLAAVKLPTHVQENDTSARFWSNRYKVSMTKYTFDLLTAYLQEGGPLLRILSIINRRMRIEVLSGVAVESEEEEYFATGDEPAPVDLTKQWGDLPLNGMDLPMVLAKDAQRATAVEPEGKRARKSDKIEEEPSPPPPVPQEETIQLIHDYAHRATISSKSAPSALLFTFLNTAGELCCADMSRDGSLISAGFCDGSVRVWDVMGGQGKEEGTDWWRRGFGRSLKSDGYVSMRGHGGAVYGTVISSDKKWVVSGGQCGSARLWSLATESCVGVYRGHAFPVWSVDMSQSGFYFATASHDRTARLWYTDRPSPIRIFAGHTSDVDCVKFHPSSRYLLTGSDDRSVRLWDVNMGDSVRLFVGHRAGVSSVAVSSDGKYAASGDNEGTVIVWDMGSGSKVTTLKGHTGAVYSLDFSFGPGSMVLSSSGSDCTVRIWDIASTADDVVCPPPSVWQSDSTKHPTLPLAFATKNTPVSTSKFTNRNLLLCAGAFDATSATAK